jgi:hypothetical protein
VRSLKKNQGEQDIANGRPSADRENSLLCCSEVFRGYSDDRLALRRFVYLHAYPDDIDLRVSRIFRTPWPVVQILTP